MKKSLIIYMIAVVCVGILVWIFILQEPKKEEQEPVIVHIPPPVMKFGLPIDSFCVEQAMIKNNQNLSDILSAHGISLQMIDRIARASAPVFDVRKLKKDNAYYCFSSKDSLKKLAYFIYEIDQVDYVVYDLADSLHIYKGQKPVTRKIRTASGVIYSSLWKTMEDNLLNPVLALEMSDIYQWSVDFFGIQKGDQFRVIYEESFVDSVSVGVTAIHACEFKHAGEGFYAFRFKENDTIRYFNEKAENLQKAFLKAPLEFSRISSRFSHSRLHPVLKFRRPHHGIDYAAASGTPVVSIGAGVVTRKGYQAGGGGNYLYIKHNSVYTSCYMHLKGFAKGVAPGVRVSQGQLIGYVGSTGLATGPHLDFRIFRNGSPVDPLKVKSEPGKPVSKGNLPEFTQLKDSLMTEIQKIDLSCAL
ncbi:MAG: M23 family metallopeptidase [Mangrovibacterium sp.]|nr:M23 family metallopeptidase [Mangrovibacterium sp.]